MHCNDDPGQGCLLDPLPDMNAGDLSTDVLTEVVDVSLPVTTDEINMDPHRSVDEPNITTVGTLLYKVMHPGGLNVRKGLELSSEVVKAAACGDIIEVTPLTYKNSTGALRVRMADGDGYTSLSDGQGTTFLKFISKVHKKIITRIKDGQEVSAMFEG